MKILFASSSLLAKPVLDYLSKANINLVGALSMPDAPKGRGREIAENDFSRLCHEYGLTVYKPQTSDELLDVLSNTEADLVITLAYGKLIRTRELAKPKYGWLNIHFSLLPRWRGAAPAQRAIEAGDRRTGVTVFKLDEGLDTGPIYATADYELKGNEDSSSLLVALSESSVMPLRKALEMISNNQAPLPQSEAGTTIAPKLSKEEGKIDWELKNIELERKIRAFLPWPAAWTHLGEQRISILAARCVTADLKPGEISASQILSVGCGEGALEILSLKPEGKRAMSAAEWLRGARLTPSSKFQ